MCARGPNLRERSGALLPRANVTPIDAQNVFSESKTGVEEEKACLVGVDRDAWEAPLPHLVLEEEQQQWECQEEDSCPVLPRVSE